MKICSLSSGSKGNSIFIETEHSRILVDIGLSARQISNRLRSIEVEPDEIDAIVLTHAHGDHVRGAGVFSRQYGTPLHAHPDTLDAISYLFNRKEKVVPWSQPFNLQDVTFTPFPVSHDAVPTVGYLISIPNLRLVVCTDLGVATDQVSEHIRLADVLIIESNHDPDMLMNGPYPWDLKERISSRTGHLSNHETGLLLKNVRNGRLRKIFLAHLSEENNDVSLAKNTVLEYIGPQCEDDLVVLEQKIVSDVFQF